MGSALSDKTLVLNRSWVAITTTTVRAALVLLYRASAHAVCPQTFRAFDFEGWLKRSADEKEAHLRAIATPCYRILAPEVILLRHFDGYPRRHLTFSRRHLYRRDDYTCQYCGRRTPTSELTIDHVVPKSLGGDTSWENCVLACSTCNARKADRTPRAAGLHLIRPPRTPRWSPVGDIRPEGAPPGPVARPESWSRFLSMSMPPGEHPAVS